MSRAARKAFPFTARRRSFRTLAAYALAFAAVAGTAAAAQPDGERNPTGAAALRTLFTRLADGFTAGDPEAIRPLLKAPADERERIVAALRREFVQSRYLDFAILGVAPDDSGARRQAVDVRIRYKLAHPGETPAAPAGQVVEVLADDDGGGTGGHWLEVPLLVPASGKYELLLDTAQPHAWDAPLRLSPFAWSVDGGPERQGFDAESARTGGELLPLGIVDLKEGAHTFRLRLAGRRETPDRQYAFWLAAVVARRKTALSENPKAGLAFEAESGRWSSGWRATPFIGNRTVECFLAQRLDDGSYMLNGSEFFDTLGLRQGMGVVMANAVLAVMLACALMAFWIWMGCEAYRARPRYRYWRFAVLLPLAGPLLFFIFAYLPRLLRAFSGNASPPLGSRPQP